MSFRKIEKKTTPSLHSRGMNLEKIVKTKKNRT